MIRRSGEWRHDDDGYYLENSSVNRDKEFSHEAEAVWVIIEDQWNDGDRQHELTTNHEAQILDKKQRHFVIRQVGSGTDVAW